MVHGWRLKSRLGPAELGFLEPDLHGNRTVNAARLTCHHAVKSCACDVFPRDESENDLSMRTWTLICDDYVHCVRSASSRCYGACYSCTLHHGCSYGDGPNCSDGWIHVYWSRGYGCRLYGSPGPRTGDGSGYGFRTGHGCWHGFRPAHGSGYGFRTGYGSWYGSWYGWTRVNGSGPVLDGRQCCYSGKNSCLYWPREQLFRPRSSGSLGPGRICDCDGWNGSGSARPVDPSPGSVSLTRCWHSLLRL